MSGFNRGDKVRITPKTGGETVIVGIVERKVKIDEYDEYHEVTVNPEGDDELFIDAWFTTDHWNIEVIKPTVLEIVQSLGVHAVVAAKGWCPFVKTKGGWYEVGDNGHTWGKSDDVVAGYIERRDFQVLSEGIRDE